MGQIISSITSHQCYLNFTGCRSASTLRTSCHSWCTMLHQSISSATVYRYHHCREMRTAFFCQRHSGQSADKNCSWSSRVQSVLPCDVECSADRTAYATACLDTFGKQLKTCLFESACWERIRWYLRLAILALYKRTYWLIGWSSVCWFHYSHMASGTP